MNLLIVGGLLVVGILAILGLVFVMMGEGRARAASTLRSQEAQASLPSQQSRQAVHTASEASARAVSQAASPLTEPASVSTAPTISVPAKMQVASSMNGQFHELSTEIHRLHQQVQEIEHRLSVLTNMVDSIERGQRDYSDIEDEMADVSETVV